MVWSAKVWVDWWLYFLNLVKSSLRRKKVRRELHRIFISDRFWWQNLTTFLGLVEVDCEDRIFLQILDCEDRLILQILHLSYLQLSEDFIHHFVGFCNKLSRRSKFLCQVIQKIIQLCYTYPGKAAVFLYMYIRLHGSVQHFLSLRICVSVSYDKTKSTKFSLVNFPKFSGN